MVNCQHNRTTRSGSNEFSKQIKCQDCEKILFKWFLEAPISKVASCLQGHFVPLVDLQNFDISSHSEYMTLVEENRALKADNLALTQQVQKVQKERTAADEELQAHWELQILKLRKKLLKLKTQAQRHMENQKPHENQSESDSSNSEFEVIRPARQNAFKKQAKVTSSDQ